MNTDPILREYQRRDIEFMVGNRRVLNANEPGLGKTLESLLAIKELDGLRALIVCPKMAMGVWREEAEKWCGWSSIIYTGKPEKRKEIRREFDSSNAVLLIVNYALLEEVKLWRPKWKTIVVDEAHLGGLLNRKSEKFKIMKKMHSINLFILTGTPVRRGPQDLWTLLHLLDKPNFGSFWRYVGEHCHVVDNGRFKEILGRPQNVKEFKKMLSQYMVRNLKEKVLEELPDKQRQPLIIELEDNSLRIYGELLEQMIADLGADLLVTSNAMTRDMRLRQLLVCPRLLGIDEDGPALETLSKELIPLEFDAHRSVVVATPFRQAVPHIRRAIEDANPGVHIEEIHGKIKENASDVALRFQKHPSKKKVLIYTIKSGASWTAHAASTGFMLGYEWDPNECLQAEDRIHRIGQKHAVHWYYLLHENTIDELVLDVLRKKRDASSWTIDTQDMLDKVQELKRR